MDKLMSKIIFIITSLLALVITSCKPSPDYNAIRSEIIKLHREYIKAHLEKDASFIAKPTSSNYVFVSDGEIQNIFPEQLESNLSDYLNSTEFSVYRDLAEPIVGVSKDGSLAWAIVKVRTAGMRKYSDKPAKNFDLQWAWITIYENKNSQWIRVADVSTDKPYEENTN